MPWAVKDNYFNLFNLFPFCFREQSQISLNLILNADTRLFCLWPDEHLHHTHIRQAKYRLMRAVSGGNYSAAFVFFTYNTPAVFYPADDDICRYFIFAAGQP